MKKSKIFIFINNFNENYFYHFFRIFREKFKNFKTKRKNIVQYSNRPTRATIIKPNKCRWKVQKLFFKIIRISKRNKNQHGLMEKEKFPEFRKISSKIRSFWGQEKISKKNYFKFLTVFFNYFSNFAVIRLIFSLKLFSIVFTLEFNWSTMVLIESIK